MTDLVVRRLLIDLEAPFDRHWCDGDAFLSAYFNALSMSFPVGEQFFIDSVRNAHKALPADRHAALKDEVQGFVGQEATHRRIHALFNGHVERQGFVNDWGPKALRRMKLLDGSDPRHPLAITAANEHFTAIFADWLLENHPRVFGTATEPRLRTMWLWHAAEESEHKSTALDVYRALGGDERWRRIWFRRVTAIFLTDTLVQTVKNLRRDGTLWRWSTWRSAWRHMAARDGMLRSTFGPWRAYFRQGFHPDDLGSDLAERWLKSNADAFRVV
jgi:predicted metal-dependent hydrolase